MIPTVHGAAMALGLATAFVASPVMAPGAAAQTSCDGCVATDQVTVIAGDCEAVVDFLSTTNHGACEASASPPHDCLFEPCSAYVDMDVWTEPNQEGVQQCFQATPHVGSGMGTPGHMFCRTLDMGDAGHFNQLFTLTPNCGSTQEVSVVIASCGLNVSYSIHCSKCD